MITNVDPTTLADEPAWRDLEAKLRPFIAKRVGGVDVDDVLQDVFLRIQRGLPTLRDEQRLGPWIYQTARHALVDHLRSAARHPHTQAEPPEPAHDPQDNDDDVATQVAGYAALFVSRLPSPDRDALTLTELEGLSQKDAADQLGLSLTALKSRVARGRDKVRKALEACCHIILDSRRHVVGCEPRAHGDPPDGCCT